MDRYSRQALLTEIGTTGQKILQQKTVALVGIGALGTVSAELLARAGLGKLLLIDRDVVELSNLQRQSLFTERDLEKGKAETAKEKLKKINSEIEVEANSVHLNYETISLLEKADLILDCTDNLVTRFLINDYCKKNSKSWVYSAAIGTSGYVMPILPGGPCLRCFLEEANLDTCDTVGVLNTITVSIAALQVTLALKILLGKETEPILHHYDIWNHEYKKLIIKTKKDCPACNKKFTYLNEPENKILRFCASGKYQIQGPKPDLKKIKSNWQQLGEVIDDGVTLQFKSVMLFKDGRALIKAGSEEEARIIYSKYIGN
ncbi:MAG: ThiF family adenylyltransferase [Nanoarchaeota archaeon]|nr:ThiF family adenylyltransferase [Nanoarchaeota archaeon]MBU1644672.1 ThiF family adenylyltransferase [Nanoarchaeota archaeon]MBU1976567.1 ThiF family adenylyltransferase [Nanoarchaeota archaeon]